MLFEKVIRTYKDIYNLPELIYEEKVSWEFLRFYKKTHYFVIIAIYNPKKEILLVRDFDKNIGWEIPGGGINKNEDIVDAIRRITLKETGLEIDELEPVAILKNFFICEEEKILHSGLAFMAMSRGKVKKHNENIKSLFTNDTKIKTVYQNDKIIQFVQEKLHERQHELPYKEIDSVKNVFFRYIFYVFHKYIIKQIGMLSSIKIDKEILNLITGKPKSILDVSCGDSLLINRLYQKYNPEICIANDVSWEIINFIKNKITNNVTFTNHNILNLPFKNVFDLVIFKNTLHHIDVKYQIELINNLKKISRQLIIVDIDNPRYSGILSKIWNSYYKYFLSDCGNYFLSFEKFRKIIKDETKGLDHKVGLIKTVKGKYFFASLNMPH